MNRHKWRFTYTTEELLEASKKQREKHLGKMQWWERKKEEAMEEAKKDGIVITESMAASYSNTKAGFGPQVGIKRDIQTKLTEAFEKILEHDAKAKKYYGWVQIFTARDIQEKTTQPIVMGRYKLDHEDWLYFFGE